MPSIAEYVKERKANGAPLQVIWRELIAMGGDINRQQAALAAAQRVEDVLMARNQKGIGYEKSGDLKRAIAQYEANVKDHIDGCHAYERLRIIYTHMGKMEDAARVCRAYIDHGQPDPARKQRYQEFLKTIT